MRVSCHLKSYNGVTGAQALLRVYIMSREQTYYAQCSSQQQLRTLTPERRNVNLPTGLQSLTFGKAFNQNIDNLTLPNGLLSLTFGEAFNQSMDNVTLPIGLQSLTFDKAFDQSMENVTLPNGLQTLTFGEAFN